MSRASRPPAGRPLRHPLIGVALLLLAAPATAAAQDGFLFSAPAAGVTLRAGPMLFAGNGDLFRQLRRDLTLDRRDFAAPALGADFYITPLPRLDLVVGVGYAEASSPSEFRDWVDQDDRPIEQTTRLRTVPLTASMRVQLLPRGRAVSSVAWVPRSVTPYVGAGGGIAWYRLEQTGDFIDFRDDGIYEDWLSASSSVLTLHALAGADYWISPRFGINGEARYSRGSADPDGSFRSFDRLDLSGVQASLGVSFRW